MWESRQARYLDSDRGSTCGRGQKAKHLRFHRAPCPLFLLSRPAGAQRRLLQSSGHFGQHFTVGVAGIREDGPRATDFGKNIHRQSQPPMLKGPKSLTWKRAGTAPPLPATERGVIEIQRLAASQVKKIICTAQGSAFV